MQFAEACEIGVLKKDLSRFVHFFRMQRMRYFVLEGMSENVFPSGNEILIFPGNGVESRVSFGKNVPDSEQGDILREYPVYLVCKYIGVLDRIGIEMSNHCPGVNSRVRSSGSGNRNWLTEEHPDSRFDFLLHGISIRLDLPAAIIASIV